MKDWWIYKGDRATDRLARLAEHQPPWRTFDGEVDLGYEVPSLDDERYAADRERGAGYIADEPEIDLVNTALYLRRPLLVTGVPGAGKSTLAHSIAEDLELGPVLRWPITSRTTLRDGLYRYDALRRLEDANLGRLEQRPDQLPAESTDPGGSIGRYLQLGPLGTAFLPTERPRVLLIDEIDKGDIDLPGDLLTVLDEGRFDIPELVRLSESTPRVAVGTDDQAGRAWIVGGRVRCRAFPVVVLTSNGEREFPPAFLRRCIRLNLPLPDEDKLHRIIVRRIGRQAADEARGPGGVIETFLKRRSHGELATDQLLNAVQLRLAGAWTAPEDLARLADATMHQLSGPDAT
ncbi:AAA family ATPase [Streptomyces glaucescens]|uniref:ATPase AAA n=1 Tax=Streptomyces glaucescens TaxID=1907 RepID=A0A089XEB6_STRGA|nr:MoxR family ATPase [Streptomyces glaucescens]AIS01609.1 ATPase AAA [Streptomyces glaucescens]